MKRRFCADLARENDEPLGATASRIDHWLLIEYRGLWARDAVSGSGLSDQVKGHLRDQVAHAPHGRLLFIRRPDRRGHPGLLAFAVASRPGVTKITRTEFEAYDDLRGLDLRDGETAGHPLFLVCTHGKHDPCCARFGRPLFEALAEQVEEEAVWQTTHIGGDRFAGNLVCLPEGLYYGRVDRETAGSVLDEHFARRVAMSNFRGRSIYTFAVQAAERFVRELTGLVGIDVTFVAVGGEQHRVRVADEPGDLTQMTCASESLERPRRYVVSRA